MSVLEALLVLGVGFFAGSINTIVGSGSLVTFPTLLAIGYSPVVANVSNTVGLVFGSISGAFGYRRELQGQQRRATVLGGGSFIGGLTGAVLLLTLPSSVFDDVVPVLILIACGLVIAQPRLSAMVASRRRRQSSSTQSTSRSTAGRSRSSTKRPPWPRRSEITTPPREPTACAESLRHEPGNGASRCSRSPVSQPPISPSTRRWSCPKVPGVPRSHLRT
jgi:uncharacterized membrane protein YfcA